MTVKLSHLETNITTACTNRCIGCNHFVAIQKHTFTDPSTIARDLRVLSKIAHAKGYALLGGEPTLHPQIDEIARIAKSSNIADRVEIWTNGQTIEGMRHAAWFSFDHLVVSLYPGKQVDLEYIRSKCDEFCVTLEIKDFRHDRFTAPLSKDHASPEQAAIRYSRCWYKNNTHVVDDGYFYRCCTSPFIPSLILKIAPTADGLPLANITEQRLLDFLHQHETPKSCYRCGGHDGRKIEWGEASNYDVWMEASSV